MPIRSTLLLYYFTEFFPCRSYRSWFLLQNISVKRIYNRHKKNNNLQPAQVSFNPWLKSGGEGKKKKNSQDDYLTLRDRAFVDGLQKIFTSIQWSNSGTGIFTFEDNELADRSKFKFSRATAIVVSAFSFFPAYLFSERKEKSNKRQASQFWVTLLECYNGIVCMARYRVFFFANLQVGFSGLAKNCVP